MKKLPLYPFLPPLLMLAGVLGASCSQSDNGSAAAQAAYIAALQSATMYNTMASTTVTSTVMMVTSVTVVQTVPNSSTGTGTVVTIIN